MATRNWSWFLLSAAAISILAGCGGGSTANVQNPPAPSSSPVSIAFQPTPPSSLTLNSAASLTAVVSNDPTSSGVDWSLNCQNPGTCGSISPPHTTSNQATTYTPPTTLAANQEAVSVIAFATADHTKNITAPLSVSAFGSVLKGTYVLETSGSDISGFPYQRAGVIVLDGNGGVTSGEQTVNFLNPTTGTLSSVTDAVLGGSYFVGVDGRGTLTINTADVNVGSQGTCASASGNIPCGVETFSLVVLSSSQAFLTYQGGNEISVGNMDQQTSATTPTMGYAFVASGTDVNSFASIALGGVLNMDTPGGISGAGSVVDLAYDDGSGLVTDPSSSVTGTVSTTPDPLGAILITLQVSNASTGLAATIEFTAYIVDATHMKLIESDTNPNSNTGSVFGVTTGVAVGQGSATGTLKGNKSFSGTYVFGVFGEDASQLLSSLASAGTFMAGSGTLSRGYLDEFQYQGGADLEISDQFHGTYAVDPTGTGRVDTLSPTTSQPSITFRTPSNGTGPELVFYVTGAGKPALVLDADAEPALGGAGVGTGIAYPAVAAASFGGPYGFSFAQNQFGSDVDATGQITVSGAGFSGTFDTSNSFQGATPLSGSLQTTSIGDRLTGTFLSNQVFPSNLGMAFYVIDSSHGFFIETDGGANGANPGILTFGYLAGRTPVCQGCP